MRRGIRGRSPARGARPAAAAPLAVLAAAVMAAAILAAVALAAAVLAAPAAAQAVDRGALEALFGEPVTTAATGKPQRVSEVPVAMEIVTAEQIRRSGAHDLPAVLARTTSLDVLQLGAHDHTVGVRGYATPMAPRLLVLVNGRQVYLDHYGYVAWDAIPVQLAEIRQIEVVKGPNSALFGFNAVAGVINIVTFDPALDRVNTATLRAGSGRYREATAVATAPFGDGHGIRLSAGLRKEDAWRRGYTEFELGELDARRAPTRTQFAADTTFRLSDHVRAGFDVSYGRSLGGDFYDYGQAWRQDKRVWSLRGRIAADTAHGLVEASLYHNAFDGTYAATSSDYSEHHAVTVAQLSNTVKLGGAHTVRPFVELRHSRMQAFTGSELGYDAAAAGAMWNWAITDRLEFTLALRYDHLWLGASGYDDPAFPYGDRDYDKGFGRASWSFGLMWRATERDSFRFSLARGVGLPSLSDLGYRDSYPEFGYQDAGSPNMRPTVVDDIQLGWRRRVEAIDGRIGLGLFHQVNRGFSSGFSVATLVPPAVPLDTYSPYNLGSSRVTGIDVSAAGRVGAGFGGVVDWGLEYRLAAVSAEFRPALIDFKHGSPRHLVSARLGWAGGAWELDLYGRYASQTQGWRVVNDVDSVLVTVRDHAALAARIGYRLNDRLTLALEGENLLQERQRQSIAMQAERRVYLSLRADF